MYQIYCRDKLITKKKFTTRGKARTFLYNEFPRYFVRKKQESYSFLGFKIIKSS